MKIIEITAEKMTAQQLEEVKTSTLKEIHVLNMVKGHPSISMCAFFPFRPSDILLVFCVVLKYKAQNFFLFFFQ